MKKTLNPKDLIGSKKPNISLVPMSSIIFKAKVMELGAKKYGAFNWRNHPVKASVYIDAALRHMYSYFDGEELDQESGVTHLAHAGCCLDIMIDAKEHGMLIDDRPKFSKNCSSTLINKLTNKDNDNDK